MATAMPNNVGSGSPKMTVGDGGGSQIDNDEGKKSYNRVMPCMTSSRNIECHEVLTKNRSKY